MDTITSYPAIALNFVDILIFIYKCLQGYVPIAERSFLLAKVFVYHTYL
jgi:hypothetical protein